MAVSYEMIRICEMNDRALQIVFGLCYQGFDSVLYTLNIDLADVVP